MRSIYAHRAHVLLSGYRAMRSSHSPLYDELYGDWDRAEVKATANHNGNSEADVQRTEVLWSNRPLSQQASFTFDREEALDAA